MSRLIFANRLNRQANRHAWLRELLFSLESFIVHLFWWSFRALSPGQAARIVRAEHRRSTWQTRIARARDGRGAAPGPVYCAALPPD